MSLLKPTPQERADALREIAKKLWPEAAEELNDVAIEIEQLTECLADAIYRLRYLEPEKFDDEDHRNNWNAALDRMCHAIGCVQSQTGGGSCQQQINT